jgi:hypothetical protein
VANFLTTYTLGENVGARDGEEVPDDFANMTEQRIFDAVFPGGDIPEISECAGAPR